MKPESYETFTIEGNFQTTHSCSPGVFLLTTVGELMPLFLGRRVILVGSLVGFLKNCSSSVVTQSRVHLLACLRATLQQRERFGHRAVNIRQPVGCRQLMNEAINHIAIRRPTALF